MARTVAILIALVIDGAAQAPDGTPCDSYDVATGKGVCGGGLFHVDVAAVICGGGFDPSACNATMLSTDGGTDLTIYFKGTPTGLPDAGVLKNNCSEEDFPAAGGVPMAVVYTGPEGEWHECAPLSNITDTVLKYSAESDNGTPKLTSVTVCFGMARDSGGTVCEGFIQINCVDGGPTSGFEYNTSGGDAAGIYGVSTTADCNPPPQPAQGYECFAGTCLPSNETGAVPLAECTQLCHKLYTCKAGVCAPTNSTTAGVPQEQCESICAAPTGLYLCLNSTCIESVIPNHGVDRKTCESICQ